MIDHRENPYTRWFVLYTSARPAPSYRGSYPLAAGLLPDCHGLATVIRARFPELTSGIQHVYVAKADSLGRDACLAFDDIIAENDARARLLPERDADLPHPQRTAVKVHRYLLRLAVARVQTVQPLKSPLAIAESLNHPPLVLYELTELAKTAPPPNDHDDEHRRSVCWPSGTLVLTALRKDGERIKRTYLHIPAYPLARRALSLIETHFLKARSDCTHSIELVGVEQNSDEWVIVEQGIERRADLSAARREKRLWYDGAFEQFIMLENRLARRYPGLDDRNFDVTAWTYSHRLGNDVQYSLATVRGLRVAEEFVALASDERTFCYAGLFGEMQICRSGPGYPVYALQIENGGNDAPIENVIDAIKGLERAARQRAGLYVPPDDDARPAAVSRMTIEGSHVVLDGNSFTISQPSALAALRSLLHAGGRWVNSAALGAGAKASRVINEYLPAQIQAIVESQSGPGGGYRLTIFDATSPKSDLIPFD